MWILVILAVIIVIVTVISINEKKYRELETEVLKKLGFSNWNVVSYYDEYVTVKSRQALEKYDDVKFFKENREKLVRARNIIKRKNEIAIILKNFLDNNEYKQHSQYNRILKQINEVVRNADGRYRICVTYISSAGNNLGERLITVSEYDINRFEEDPSLLMSKGEYSKLLKEQQKEALTQKQHEYYDRVNKVIDYANENRESFFI